VFYYFLFFIFFFINTTKGNMYIPILVAIALVAVTFILYFSFRTEKFTSRLTRDYTPLIGKFQSELQGTMEEFTPPIGALRNGDDAYPLFSNSAQKFTVVDKKRVPIVNKSVETGDIIHVPGIGTLQVILF
jgi:hypothetical protein